MKARVTVEVGCVLCLVWSCGLAAAEGGSGVLAVQVASQPNETVSALQRVDRARLEPLMLNPVPIGPDGGLRDERACTGVLSYANEAGTVGAFAPGANTPLADDMTLAASAGCLLTCYDLVVQSATGTPAYDVTVSIYDDAGGVPGTLIPGTDTTWTALATGGAWRLEAQLGAVAIPRTVWMVVTFSTANAAWQVAGAAETGSTDDVFAEFGGSPPEWSLYWFGPYPNPYAGFRARLYTDHCLPGATAEGEPLCADEYIDTYNGGCNSNPNVFQAIACDEVICGEYGTFLVAGAPTRDTDWYAVTIAEPAELTWTVLGEAPTAAAVLAAASGCAEPVVLAGQESTAGCTLLEVTTPCLPAGTYWLFVAPVGTVACGTRYTAVLTCASPCTPGAACCFSDGHCELLATVACVAAGGVPTSDLVCDPNPCPQPPPNDTCATAIAIPTPLPVSVAGTTVLATNDAPTPACGVMTGPFHNVWYTVTGTGNTMTVATCNAATAIDTKISVFCGPDCNNLFCVAGNDDNCTDPAPASSVSFCSRPGQTYFVTVGVYSDADPDGPFQLDVSDDGTPCTGAPVCEPCVIPCESGDVAEGEPPCGPEYNDTFNGGCNATPPVFNAIACGDTVCGESGNFVAGTDHHRDLDWYQLITTEPLSFTFAVNAEFPVQVAFLDGGLGCDNMEGFALTSTPCVPAAAETVCLPPGTYWFVVGPSTFEGVNCGARYRATLTCAPCRLPQGACCTATGCFVTYERTCQRGGGVYLGDDTPCAEMDCNNNGQDDACDILVLPPVSEDCNNNLVPDECDIAGGTSEDANHSGIPDECEILRADMNCDGAVNFDDINPFVTALISRAGYEARYPTCLWLNGDINDDDSVDFDDINPFVACLVGGQCP
jgi:hypothetical protein